jgi:hypothetical protein
MWFAEFNASTRYRTAVVNKGAKTMGLGIILAILVLLYFMPFLVAAGRDHHNAGAIGVTNLFLGWTGLGWVIALIWASTVVRRSTQDTIPT